MSCTHVEQRRTCVKVVCRHYSSSAPLPLNSSAQRSAYERNSQACSVFNRALRDGLEKRKNAVRDLGPHISEGRTNQRLV